MICRNCGAGLEAGRIDTSLGIIACAHCGSLYNIPASGKNEATDGTAGQSAGKPKHMEVALPKKFKVQRTSGGMQVIWPVGGLFQGLIVTMIAVAFTYVALTSGMLWLLIASAGLLYVAAGQAFNKHRIRVDGARLEVMQGPVPWKGSHKLDAADIEQLYATEYESRTQSNNSGDHRVTIHKYYRLSASTRSGERVKILGGLRDPLQALWLEQEIERLLGITDKPIVGEYQH